MEDLDRLENLLDRCKENLDEELRLECLKLALKLGVFPTNVDQWMENSERIYQYVKKGLD